MKTISVILICLLFGCRQFQSPDPICSVVTAPITLRSLEGEESVCGTNTVTLLDGIPLVSIETDTEGKVMSTSLYNQEGKSEHTLVMSNGQISHQSLYSWDGNMNVQILFDRQQYASRIQIYREGKPYHGHFEWAARPIPEDCFHAVIRTTYSNGVECMRQEITYDPFADPMSVTNIIGQPQPRD